MSGFIYVIASSNGLYKIGYTNDPPRRLTMLRTSTADTLTLLGTVHGTLEQEAQLHNLLRGARVAREWFKPCAAMQPLLDSLTPPGVPSRRRKHKTYSNDEPWRMRLRSAVATDGRPYRKLSLAAGMGPNFVHEILSTHKSPSVESLSRLTKVLGTSMGELFPEAA